MTRYDKLAWVFVSKLWFGLLQPLGNVFFNFVFFANRTRVGANPANVILSVNRMTRVGGKISQYVAQPIFVMYKLLLRG
jgi:hypothetical protein